MMLMTCSLGVSRDQRDREAALHRGHRGGRPGRAALRHRLGARGQGQRLPRPLVQEGLRHSHIQVILSPCPTLLGNKK